MPPEWRAAYREYSHERIPAASSPWCLQCAVAAPRVEVKQTGSAPGWQGMSGATRRYYADGSGELTRHGLALVVSAHARHHYAKMFDEEAEASREMHAFGNESLQWQTSGHITKRQ